MSNCKAATSYHVSFVYLHYIFGYIIWIVGGFYDFAIVDVSAYMNKVHISPRPLRPSTIN